MAGGPIFPYSPYPATEGNTFPWFYEGDGGVSPHELGLGIKASIGDDSIWELRFAMPPVLPTGTCKLRMFCMADAVAGAAKINPKWKSTAMGEDPTIGALHAEGTSTVTWGAGDDDDYKELKITLDADTVVANEVIVMDLVFETAGWTLAELSTYVVFVIWE